MTFVRGMGLIIHWNDVFTRGGGWGSPTTRIAFVPGGGAHQLLARITGGGAH